MKEIILGSKNPAKIDQMRFALQPLGIMVRSVAEYPDLPEVIEDGKTAPENARKKAITYAISINKTVMSLDSALFIDSLPQDKQPGINTRRIPGFTTRPSDEDVQNYYSGLIKQYGDAPSHFEYSIAIAKPDGQIFETTIIAPPRHFTSKISSKTISGFPIESMQIDPETGKYVSEMSEDEQSTYWQSTIGKQVRDFISKLSL